MIRIVLACSWKIHVQSGLCDSGRKTSVIEGDTIYGGFYTQEEIKEIVNYASDRGIDVIPEIDMPGHFLAAIQQYPDIACDGLIGWGQVFSSPICVGKDSTLEFCKTSGVRCFSCFLMSMCI